MTARSRVARIARGLVVAGAVSGAMSIVLASGCDPEPEDAPSHDGAAPGGVAEAVRDAVAERVAAAAEVDGGEPEGHELDDGEPEGETKPGADAVQTSPAPAGPRPIVLRRPWPPTTLPLALLATMGAQEEPEPSRIESQAEASSPARGPARGAYRGQPRSQSRATIRDEDSGVIASYRLGDHIREDVEVLAIEDGLVELSNAGEVEYLSISEIPVELSAGDVFYPDLVDDLRLSGSMEDGALMPPGPEYTLKASTYSWATPRTIALLRDAIREYARGRNAPKVHLGDISLRGGGPFSPHLSHQEGRDVDIAYVLHDRDARFGVATAGSLDRARTWSLLRALLDTRAITYVFIDYEVQRLLYEHAQLEGMTPEQLDPLFQYPYGRRAARGLIRHWKGHRDHFHVRFAG